MWQIKNKCYNKGTKHNFEARYDEVPYPGKIEVARGGRDMLYYKIYVKDVCVWCGKEIKR